VSVADAWNPEQYDRFKAERSQPFWDLAGLLGDVPLGARLVDLGCGTGELTAALAARLSAADTLGVDFAATMLAEAGAHTSATVRFELGDLASFTDPGAWDVVFSNAALQWVPDHPGVLTRWAAALRPCGVLAVQVPANADHPSHTVAAEVAEREPFRSALAAGPPPDPVAGHVLTPERYCEVLVGLGLREVHVRLQVYPHVLAHTADIVEWVKGTTLNRYRAALPGSRYDEFVAAYRVALLDRLGDRSPCLYPFKRILMRGFAA
jgi:trans-aconitate 2-methyltransferase